MRSAATQPPAALCAAPARFRNDTIIGLLKDKFSATTAQAVEGMLLANARYEQTVRHVNTLSGLPLVHIWGHMDPSSHAPTIAGTACGDGYAVCQ
jgi:hypothetical protein